MKGFTLIELVIVIAILGILSAYALLKNASPSELSLPSQAETMASNIRYLQNLATAGAPTRLTVTPGAGGSGHYLGERCNADCSAYSAVFDVDMEKKVSLTAPGGVVILGFDTQGTPSAAASYVLSADGSSKNVTVAALTGHVTVTTPP